MSISNKVVKKVLKRESDICIIKDVKKVKMPKRNPHRALAWET